MEGDSLEIIAGYFNLTKQRIHQIIEGSICYCCGDMLLSKSKAIKPTDEGCDFLIERLIQQRSLRVPLDTAKKIMKAIFDEPTTDAPEEAKEEEASESKE